MRLWLTKLSVVLITFMTFGMFIPPTYLDAEANDQELVSEDKLSSTTIINPESANESLANLAESKRPIDPYEQFVAYAAEQAKYQSFQKFGPKIVAHVQDEFIDAILPKVEEVIRELAQNANEADLVRFEVSEKPASGYGERIFHIFDQQTKEDVARFHVKRVNHPKKGFSFNFHYHLQKDKFEHHYHLGNIDWNKNTPPKWMS
ncbi:YpjP family protein [Bacillaceae bacterium IKA-2]|jgi:hypothetical protein|nr:YpjP family protein [Bacillaceae bacterium IKA-2]